MKKHKTVIETNSQSLTDEEWKLKIEHVKQLYANFNKVRVEGKALMTNEIKLLDAALDYLDR